MGEALNSRVANTRRIAVLRAGALGDLIFTLPALDALRAAYPEAEIVLLGKPWMANLLHERPGPVDRVVIVPPVRGVGTPENAGQDERALNAFFAQMQAERFDIALQLHGGGRYSNPFVTRLGARVSAGLCDVDAAPLDRTMPYFYHQNERMRQLEAVALVGATARTLEPHLAVMPRDVDEANAIVEASPRPLAVLQPGCTDPRRRWPPEKFAAVGDALRERGAVVAINGTGDEQQLVDAVRGAIRGEAVDLCGRLSLGGLAGLMSRARVVVSNDTGPLYLAEAVGAPTVGVYWLTNLSISGPPFRTHHRYAISERTTCPTCGADNLSARCAHDDSFVADVPVDAVLEQALALF
ncbi:MAG TPA: glycosyltransferase family 9 protein [Casimicrobiaceae bacterium]|jgi:ADP-heptose:LPS heptosyltransferase|nr:glycosyltransferase family 9 protein [Casimicrobiaceae bacterium]